jgi:phospholipase C
MAETFPNRIYEHAAQTDRLDGALDLSVLPTIWDRLAQRRVAARYYFSDVPFLALWGAKYLSITRPITEFFAACAAGTLPSVAVVDPRFLGEEIGLTNDDHPHADIRNGQAFLNAIYEAVTASPNWPHTVLVINYDEWGGFFEHVAPPVAPLPPADAALGNDGRLGFRVPCLVISPWSPRGTVSHGIFDHTSVLRMIEWRWQLSPLTIRDATANNLAETLNFTRPNLHAPRFDVPNDSFGTPCPLGILARKASLDPWANLRAMADELGFPR